MGPENVCFSARDGVLIPNTTTPPPTVREFDRGRRLTAPFAARIFPRKAFNELTNAFLLEGETFASNCWRQGLLSSNPAHYMMGLGKVFVAALDSHVPRGLSTLIFQSCGHRSRAKWEWGREVWSLIEAKGNESGLLPPAGVDIVTLSHQTPPGFRVRNWPQSWPSQGDLVVCARHVSAERNSVATYLGGNRPDIVAEWQRHVHRQLTESSESRTAVPSAVSSEAGIAASPLFSDRSSRKTPTATPSNGTACASCLNSLRIAIFYRKEGSALRRFRNLAGVRAVAARYSAGRVFMVTITSRTKFAAQACDATLCLLYCAGSCPCPCSGCMWMLDCRRAFHWSCIPSSPQCSSIDRWIDSLASRLFIYHVIGARIPLIRHPDHVPWLAPRQHALRTACGLRRVAGKLYTRKTSYPICIFFDSEATHRVADGL